MAADASRRFDRTDWTHVLGMAAFIAVLTALGWFVLLVLVVPAGYALGSQGAFGAGLGLTAYLLGMRHAFDADHIAAIDNTTRKLVGRRVSGRGASGFWFSLGHSSVVLVLCLFLALGVRSAHQRARRRLDPTVQAGPRRSPAPCSSVVGSSSAAGAAQPRRPDRHRAGLRADAGRPNLDEAELEHHLNSRGFLARILGRVHPRGEQAVAHVPRRLRLRRSVSTPPPRSPCSCWPAAPPRSPCPGTRSWCMPVLFAAGHEPVRHRRRGVHVGRLPLGVPASPVRKVFYNLTVTALSVIVALVIGGVELLQLRRHRGRRDHGTAGRPSPSWTWSTSATSSSGCSW